MASEPMATIEQQAENWQEIAKQHLRNEEYWRLQAEQGQADAKRYKEDYERACKLVANMHAAAVGEVRGPDVGPVEDVAALRKWAVDHGYAD